MADLRQLTRTFVDLADTLVDEFDVIELLHVLTSRCVDLLGVDAAGVMLADAHGHLRLAAASILPRWRLKIASAVSTSFALSRSMPHSAPSVTNTRTPSTGPKAPASRIQKPSMLRASLSSGSPGVLSSGMDGV